MSGFSVVRQLPGLLGIIQRASNGQAGSLPRTKLLDLKPKAEGEIASVTRSARHSQRLCMQASVDRKTLEMESVEKP
jgi:hypothetical protein